MKERTRHIVYAALLIALAILIPIQFSFLKIYIPPFSATLAAHVPMFISMLISPMVAVVVGIGSVLGFLLAGMPIPIVARAGTHILVGYIGAKMINKNVSYLKMTVLTSIIHGMAEAVIVGPFIGFDIFQLLIVTGVGGVVHHLVDGGISYGVIRTIAVKNKKTIYTIFKNKEITNKKEAKLQV